MFAPPENANIHLGQDASSYCAAREWVKRLLAQHPSIRNISLSSHSISSPYLPEFSVYITDLGLRTFLCTNANLVDEQSIRRLSISKIHTLGFWVESLLPEVQESLRPGEKLADVLECFKGIKSRKTKTRCAFYTHILEQNSEEIFRIIEYVKIQGLVDSILLQLWGTQTPARVSSFRDIQPRFGGKPFTSFSERYFERLMDIAKERDQLINDPNQIVFWKSYLQSLSESENQALSLLEETECFRNQPVHYFSNMVELCHCEIQNPENISFQAQSFSAVKEAIHGCRRQCHFKINQRFDDPDPDLEAIDSSSALVGRKLFL